MFIMFLLYNSFNIFYRKELTKKILNNCQSTFSDTMALMRIGLVRSKGHLLDSWPSAGQIHPRSTHFPQMMLYVTLLFYHFTLFYSSVLSVSWNVLIVCPYIVNRHVPYVSLLMMMEKNSENFPVVTIFTVLVLTNGYIWVQPVPFASAASLGLAVAVKKCRSRRGSLTRMQVFVASFYTCCYFNTES